MQAKVPRRFLDLGKRRGDVNGRLLVLALVVAEIRVLLERLADARDAAVPEDAPGAVEELVLYAIAGYVLFLQKRDQRLSHRHSSCLHAWVPPDSCLSMFLATGLTRGTASRQVSNLRERFDSRYRTRAQARLGGREKRAVAARGWPLHEFVMVIRYSQLFMKNRFYVPIAVAACCAAQTVERPSRSVTDPGVVTTRQAITPAGVPSVFQGRVYGVAWAGE